MANDLLADLLNELEEIFRPLEDVARDPDLIFVLLRRLGWEIDDLVPAATALATSFQAVSSTIDQVRSVAAGGSPDIAAVMSAFRETAKIPDTFGDLQHQLESTLPMVAADLSLLPAELLELLFIDWMRRRSPLAFAISISTGLIEPQITIERVNANRLLRRAVIIDRLHFKQLSRWIANPLVQIEERFGISSLLTEEDARAYALRVFPLIAQLMSALGAETCMGRGFGLRRLSDEDELALMRMLSLYWRPPFDEGAAANIGVNITVLSAAEDGPGIMYMPFGTLALSVNAGGWVGQAGLNSTVDALFIKPGGVEFLGGSTADLVGNLQIIRPAASNRFGGKNTTRLELGNLKFSAQFHVMPTSQEFDAELNISNAAFVISAGDGDGFLQQILPKDGINIDFDLAIGWSNTRGLYFRGGAGLEATFPINKELLGVLVINSVYLAILAKESGISLAAAASVTLKLGPVTAAIQQMGLKAMLTFPERGGNLGPVNLEIGFKPPNGVGLVVDTSVVVGAGFLEFDPDNEMYSGFVYLEIVKKISVTAVGLITTRMPDGSPGFSLLALVAVQFSPGIQLGYGFTLNGLGGILGINRTVAVEVLRTGLRDGTLGSILFPADPKKNIARIISDLKAVFPPAEGRFIFGPMAILGWGPNELIKLELGLILELPDPVRLLILGRLSLKLPDEKNAVVRLKLDSFGVIDFSTGDVSLDAVLYDSEIKGFTITGDMALRANFGAAPGFLLSVGGFHPAYKPPPGFPALQRVAISLATGDNPRLRLAAYMAITTNTIQFGAALEIFAKAGPFSLVGQLSFDALIQFDPFGLAIGFGGMIAIKWDEEVVLGLMLDMNLTGPTPWHAWGGVQFKFLLFDAKIPFDVITGESQLLPPPMPVDLTDMVLKALKDSTNWSTQLPSSEHPLVVFREQKKHPDILVHPLAMLQVSQRVVPLNKSLYKFGNAPLEGGEQFFSLSVSGAAIHDSDYVEDWFAPAHFIEMNDDEKLAADSFEKEKAGIRFTQDGYICGSFIEEDEMEYETETLGDNQSAVSRGLTAQSVRESKPYVITSEFLQQVASTGAVGQSLLQKTGNTKYQIAAVKESISTPVFTVKPRSFSFVGGGVSVESGGNVIGTPTTFPMMNISSYTAALGALKENQVTFLKTRERLKIIPIVGGVSDE
ncbi:MAG: hypothetical protein Q8L02_00800 [Candidatus Nitrotoga sp.]|nr:hypothetical protein [Candidatus Nitrotoga sp.]